ncbi:Putative tyrosine-protein kinase in cps region [Pseudidiomarina piscicola]|uniref:Tyrosine-protein kinase in cps region n=1 Tax=Pseudidiomarina piscicola TaxID=2614830 RepID=A0A6S6WMD6_9GAMM|nr:polysaccharide biosynthesis tyrosine autokinase [Pseudidiomarina piscicola]CAB0151202.1 Putative tyrosine-protein kinase in cps region [Pseudidiomarina piscicola]VZT40708.1 Putative tyrosine-protein kinase in cps region [Pseudomonas aeruginosa]
MENKTVNTPKPEAKVDRHDDDEIDLGRLFGLLIDRRWLIISVTFVFMVFGVVYAVLSTPVYQADALLQVEEKSSGLPALGGEFGEMFTSESQAATEIEIMKSRMVVGAVVDQLQLTNRVTPDYMPIIGEWLARRTPGQDKLSITSFKVPQGYEGQALELEFAENGATYEVFDEAGELVLAGKVGQLAVIDGFELMINDAVLTDTDSFTLVKANRLRVIRDIQAGLSVSERGKQTGILSASFQSTDKAYAEDVLGAVAQEYMLQNIRRNAAEAENSLSFIEQEMPTVKANLTAAENQLNQYRLQSQSVDLSIETESILARVVEIEKKLNELELKEKELSRLYTKEHPTYQSLLEQKAQLQQEQQQINDQVGNLPETQQEVLRLARDVEVSQEIYVQLLNRMQELNVLKAGTVGNVRILDEAVTNPQAVAPKKSLIVVLATMLGGMVSVGYVFLMAALNRGVEAPEQLEALGINVYASVPLSPVQEDLNGKLATLVGRTKKAADLPFLALEDPADLAIEALRGLRTSLHFAMLEAQNKTIMISGPAPGVGKSFVTMNLAAVLAQAGQKVLVIDGDIRRGYMHASVGVENNYGLSDFLASVDKSVDGGPVDKNNLATIIHKTKVENMHFISRGTAAPNPSELLMHPRMEKMLDKVNEYYDYVLIDTPPILAVTDAAIVGRYAGTTLLVARFGETPAKEVEATVARFAQNGTDVRGVILNGVERRASGYYGYGYGYSYGYSYKSE